METLTAEQQLMADTAEADFKLDLWDEPPAMWAVVRSEDGSLRRVMFNFTDDFWNMAPMHLVLKSITMSTQIFSAAKIKLPLKIIGDERVVGIILRTEGWGVAGKNETDPTDTKPPIEALQAWMAEGHRLSEHPDRIEVKTYQLITESGQTTLSLDRGGDPTGKWADNFSGRVPEALAEVFAAVSEAMNK